MSLISEALRSIPDNGHAPTQPDPHTASIAIHPNRTPLMISGVISVAIAGFAWVYGPSPATAGAPPMATAVAQSLGAFEPKETHGGISRSIAQPETPAPNTDAPVRLTAEAAEPDILDALPELPVQRKLLSWDTATSGQINTLSLEFNAAISAQALITKEGSTTTVSVRLPQLHGVSAQGILEAPGLRSSHFSPGLDEWIWTLKLDHAQDIRVGTDRADEGRLLLRYRHKPQIAHAQTPASTPLPPDSARLTMTRELDQPQPAATSHKAASSPRKAAVSRHHSALRQAARHAREGDNASAVTILLKAQEQDPAWNAAAAQLLTRLLMIQKRHEEAMETMYRNIERFPDATPLRQSLAQQLLYRGLPGRSIEILGAHRPDLNLEPDYYATLAQAYFRHGQHDRAAALYARLLKIREDDSVLWAGLGVTHEARNDLASAQAAYRQAIQTATTNPRLQQQLRTQLQRLENRS